MRSEAIISLRGLGVALAATLAVTGAVTGLSTGAPAAQLDQQTCDQLKREVGDLERIGARANLDKGPVWGKSNLSSAQIEQVKKLIEIDETVAFRCPRPKPVAEKVATQTPAGGAAPGAAIVAKPKAKVAARPSVDKPNTDQPAAKAPKTVQALPKTDAAVAAPAPKPKPKPVKPAEKPTDAFVPAPKG